MLQIGLEAGKGSIQYDHDHNEKNGGTAELPNSYNWLNVLEDTIIPMFKYIEYWISAYSYGSKESNIKNAKECFLNLCKEHKRINEENVERQRIIANGVNGSNTEYIVVTILVIAKGVQVLPPISNWRDLIKALQNICFIPKSQVQEVTVFWNQLIPSKKILQEITRI